MTVGARWLPNSGLRVKLSWIFFGCRPPAAGLCNLMSGNSLCITGERNKTSKKSRHFIEEIGMT
jgi:hypothetical protein